MGKRTLFAACCALVCVVGVSEQAGADETASTWPWKDTYTSTALPGAWQLVLSPPDRISVVASPTDPTQNVLRVELRNGDVYNTSSGPSNRAEVMVHHGSNGPSGTGDWPYYHKEIWFRWKTLLDPTFPTEQGQWAVLAQWHNDSGGQPPLALDVVNGQFRLVTSDNTILWSAPLRTGVWIDFEAHIKFSPVTALGLVEFTVDGVQVVSTNVALEQCCFPLSVTPYPVYFHMGIYRDPATAGTGILYDGPIRIGDTAAWVQDP